MKRFRLFSAILISLIPSSSYAQWTFVGYAGVGSPQAISVPNCSTVVVVGGPNSQPRVWRSTNSGFNGTLLGTTGLGALELYAVWAKNKDTIFVGDGGSPGGTGGNAKVYKTYNGGLNWTQILSTGGTAGFINGIVFERPNQKFGIVVSDPPTGPGQPYWIAKTTDCGSTWTIQRPPGVSGAAGAHGSVFCIDSLFYGFGLNTGASRIVYTTNGGASWLTFTLGITGSFVSGVAFSSDKTVGIAATNVSLPNIWRNGSIINTGGGVTGYCSMKWVYTTNECFLMGSAGASGVCKRSTDAGLSWSTMTTAGITGIVAFDIFYANSMICSYAVASDESLIRLLGSLSEINEIGNSLPDIYKLEQNYPNPFNPKTIIGYSLPRASEVSLKVYDILGNEILTLVDGYQTAGNYSVTIEATSLASGLYVYLIKAWDFSDSKKMVVIK